MPLFVVVPTAEATHSGTRTEDAFRDRPVALSKSSISGSGLAANDNWRSGITTFGDRTDVSGTNSQSNSACSSSTTTSSPFTQWIYFTTTPGEDPKLNFALKDPRPLDTLHIRADIPSSGSTTTCGYLYGVQASIETGAWVETEIFLGKCPKIGGGNAANGNTQTVCNLNFANTLYDGIKLIVASGYSSYVPVAYINELQGSGIDMTPPTATPTSLTATAVGCTIAVEWNPVGDATGYHVYRDSSPTFTPSPFNRLTSTVGHASTGHTDASTVTDTTYHYKVSAYNQDGEGPPTETSQSATAGICDGSGRGSIGADSHIGPNLLTLESVTTHYTSMPSWAWTHAADLCEPMPDHRAAIACITDGNTTTGAELNSFGTFPTGGPTCQSPGWIDWNWTTPHELQTLYLSIKAIGNTGYTTGLDACARIQYLTPSGTYMDAATWTGMTHGIRSDLWANLTTPVQATGVRLYVGDAPWATAVSRARSSRSCSTVGP